MPHGAVQNISLTGDGRMSHRGQSRASESPAPATLIAHRRDRDRQQRRSGSTALATTIGGKLVGIRTGRHGAPRTLRLPVRRYRARRRRTTTSRRRQRTVRLARAYSDRSARAAAAIGADRVVDAAPRRCQSATGPIAAMAARDTASPRRAGSRSSRGSRGGRFGRMFAALAAVRPGDRHDRGALRRSMRTRTGQHRQHPHSGWLHVPRAVHRPRHHVRSDIDSRSATTTRTRSSTSERPRFDLDSLYGTGPADQPFLYDWSSRPARA